MKIEIGGTDVIASLARPGTVWKEGTRYYLMTGDIEPPDDGGRYAFVCLRTGDVRAFADRPRELVTSSFTYVGKLEITD